MGLSTIVLLSMSVVTWGLPQYVEPPEIEGHLDDAYQFAYAVASPEHGDYHGHQQSRDENGFTSGSYYLLGADGQWSQTIFADKGAGFQALYNQRPAGAPPPQVSEVTYQVFVHPGATAISAQGGAPPGGPAQPVPFGGIQQKRSLVNQQQQNNQLSQSQNGQPLRRFNRNSQQSQNNQFTQSQNVQPLRPRTNLRELDQETSASIKSNSVVVPAPVKISAHRFGGTSASDQSNKITKQSQNNQFTQSQDVQPLSRFNRNFQVPEQPTYNRDPNVLSPVVASEPRPSTNLREHNLDTPASVESNLVVNQAPVKISAPRLGSTSASDQSSRITKQSQNNQFTQSQDVQPLSSININTQVPEQPTYNRDPNVHSPVVASEPRPQTNVRERDLDTPASVESNFVVNQAPVFVNPAPVRRAPSLGKSRFGFKKATSIFTDDVSNIFRILQGRRPVPLQ